MGSSQPAQKCLFFHQPSESQIDSLAILHLKRQLQLPLILHTQDNEGHGYAEGKVRASDVDTGSRGRKDGTPLPNLKRKRTETPDEATGQKAAVAAKSGYGHLLQPTPERWTYSLPHRTQIVYTPDYSYILQRIKARPGSVLIEAGAGSGSFSHAAARAVFDGKSVSARSSGETGRVWSFEFHQQRAEELRNEIHDHGLEPLVTINHRDVYKDGFTVFSPAPTSQQLVRATAIFLDLPAPWQALPNLTRSGPNSPLDPDSAVHICTFSPCIEQVQATVPALRAHGWVDISMVELAAKRIDVRRDRVGLREEGLSGVISSAASVTEALGRLRELEERTRTYYTDAEAELSTKQDRLQVIRDAVESRDLYKEGRLVHRSEPEIKTHSSYLVFAVLPREWTEEDERKAAAAALQAEPVIKGKSKKQRKKEIRQAAAIAAAAVGAEGGPDGRD